MRLLLPLLPLLLLLPVAQADLIHVTPKQLDEALPIVDHALIHVYDDEPHAAVENITTYSSIPIYALNGTHDQFPNTSVLYMSVRNVVIPFRSQPEHYDLLVPRIPSIYEPTYSYNDNQNILINGNESMHQEVLEFCFTIPEVRCFSADFTDELLFEGTVWNTTTNFTHFMRRNIIPYPVIDVNTDSREDYLLLVRLYMDTVFVHSKKNSFKRKIRPLVQELDNSMGVVLISDFSTFRETFNTPDLTAVYVSIDRGTNKTYTGPITENSLRTFLTTCTETI